MQSLAAFFGVEDSSSLGWAHRVNTAAQLKAALEEASVHVLEGDVQFGDSDATPLIAEPGAVAELDAASFTTSVSAAGKALKLDFHAPSAVEPTLAILRLINPTTPVILHADVFKLLAARNPAEALEPEQFIRLCQHACPHAILSLGWSLKRAHDADGRVEDALIQQLSAMVLQRLGPVSYGLEIRAGYIPGAGGQRAAEHGAALLFDPLPPAPSPASHSAPNVVDLLPRLRRVA